MNIEKTISEHAVSDILTPMLESQDRIVTEDVAPLFDQATGLDTPPASGTVTTTIEESRSVITAIIRKAWTATLTMLGGASVISYIAAAYTYLRNRLQGNETYGIPDRRSEISASSPLAANLALLNDRKISEPNAIDGISLAQILCSANHPTEIEDTNKGWTMTKALTWDDLTTIQLGCGEIANNVYVVQDKSTVTHISLPNLVLLRGGISKNCANVESISVPNLEEVTTQYMTAKAIANSTALTYIAFPKLRKITQQTGLGQQYETNTMFYGCSNLDTADFPVLEELATFSDYDPRVFAGCGVRVINMPSLKKISSSGSHTAGMSWFSNLPNLETVVFGKLDTCCPNMFGSCPNLVHLEIGEGTACNLSFNSWNPTTALANNLEQFLSNFRDYIANRLTDNGSGKTLTLSQAVRNAIHAAESTYGIENIIITQKGWTISPAPN